jgi:hypothetical protein
MMEFFLLWVFLCLGKCILYFSSLWFALIQVVAQQVMFALPIMWNEMIKYFNGPKNKMYYSF